MTQTIDTPRWLQAIADHPQTTVEDLLAACHHLGANPDLTEEQLDDSTFRLHLFGFIWPVDISHDFGTYTYELQIPAKSAA